jgi:hypothetical protein
VRCSQVCRHAVVSNLFNNKICTVPVSVINKDKYAVTFNL